MLGQTKARVETQPQIAIIAPRRAWWTMRLGALWLEKGTIRAIGDVEEVLQSYHPLVATDDLAH
ncbi:hypothetical protein ACFLSW_04730 [Candidatus Bipolaricaulota bacterium]